MNKRWTPGSDAVVTNFTITKKDIDGGNQINTCEEERFVTEDNKNNTREEIRSIVFAFMVVFAFFSGVFIFKYFKNITFDNIIILITFVFSVGAFWGSHHKKDVNEVIDFKEPKI